MYKFMLSIVLSILCLCGCNKGTTLSEDNQGAGGEVVIVQETAPSRQLAYAKANIQSIRNGEAALQLLVKDADKALTTAIAPVTEKKIVAVSGDKHDYVSMGPYWWPDPTKPDGLPYIRRDGERNPEIYELDRYKMDAMIKSVVTLGYAYYFTEEERYAEKAVENLRLWFLNEETRMNPNLDYAQMIPGHNNGKGRGYGIIDVYGMIEMVDCIQLLSKSRAMKETDLKALKQWFGDFVEWLLNSENGKEEYRAANNHGTAYDAQVAAYAMFANKKEVSLNLIKGFATKRIFNQVEPDGSQPLELERTLAFHYTLFNISHMMDMAALAQCFGIDLYNATSDDGRSITQAIEFIKPYLGKPQSEFPYQQIREWGENQERLCWILRRATFFKENKEYDLLFNTYCTTSVKNRNWLLYTKQE
ncbi:MAG: alginate lyase family protein [Proteiniphilum sp.]|uniref:alginate lyase family protein n=1 Tax=Proteiniphilum sp. TaxID=1926877 RepID=UPI002ABA0957|nr:alginate lyase family protein [Proteiniphilum sp.]MDY9919969.1 alginate lyase family protein [Proteiniphilum sp.]